MFKDRLRVKSSWYEFKQVTCGHGTLQCEITICFSEHIIVMRSYVYFEGSKTEYLIADKVLVHKGHIIRY